MIKISRRQFNTMLAALPIAAVIPLPSSEMKRIVWASGVKDFTIAGFGTPKACVIIPGGVRINWGAILRQNEDMTAKFMDGLGVTHTWEDGRWSEGTPEILLEYEVVEGDETQLPPPMITIG